MITIDDALLLMAQNSEPLDSECLSLSSAHRRILAQSLFARFDAPRRPISAMDGYAVKRSASDLGSPLTVIGESRAGQGFEGALGHGQAVRIFTGAPVPNGADRVVIQEHASLLGSSVSFSGDIGPKKHIRAAGSDFQAGVELVPVGARLDARAMVAAAAADVAEVQVGKRPIVAICATGDEIVQPGTAYQTMNAIPESTSFGIAALVEEYGGNLVSNENCPDDLEFLAQHAATALEIADLVVVIGGASVGERDYGKAMFQPHGLELYFEKVSIKPGKPVWFGRVDSKLVLGLPGNPTSAMVTGALFLRSILERLQGGSGTHDWRQMTLLDDLGPTGSRETFLRANWANNGLRVIGNQESGAQAALVKADWLIRCPAGQSSVEAGKLVTALQF